MRETAEQLLIAWLLDYAATKRGESGVLADGAAADGRVYLHCHHPSACAAIYVHPTGAVAPVLAGAHDPCLNACYAAQLGKLDVASGGRFPRPAVRIDGIDRHFRHVAGRRVVGVIEDSEGFLLLGHLGSGWAVAYVEPGRAEWLATFERPGTINLDSWRALHPRPEPAVPAPEPSPPPAPHPPTPEPPRAPSQPRPSTPPTPEPPRAPSPPEPPRPPATPRGAQRTDRSDRWRVRLARNRRLHIRADPPPPAPAPELPPSHAEPPPPSPPPDLELLAITRLHERVLGVVVDNERSAAGQVLLRGLEIHVDQAAPARRSRLPILVRGIVALGRKGARSNPTGTRAQLAEVFSQVLGQRVSSIELGEALTAAREEGWEFVELDARTYTLRLSELLDIRSPFHRRFVERCILGFDLQGVDEPPATGPAPAAAEPVHTAATDWRPAQILLIALAMLVSDLAGRERPEAASQAVAAVQVKRDEAGAEVSLNAELVEMKAERDGARTDVAALRAQLAAMTAERDESRTALAARDAHLLAVQAERDQAQTALVARDAQLVAVQAERDQARTALAARDAQLVAVQTERDQARATLADRDAQSAAPQERDQAQDGAAAADDRPVVAEPDEGRTLVAQRERELAAALAEQGRTKAALDEALGERDDVRRTLATHQQQLAALLVERDEARSTIAEREAENAALRGELTLRDEQMARLEARVLRVEAARASQFASRSGAPPGDLHAGRSPVAAHANALLSAPAASSTTTVEPRGARGPPKDPGPR